MGVWGSDILAVFYTSEREVDPLRLIRGGVLKRVLPMSEAVKGVKRALSAWSSGSCQVPVRERLSLKLGDVLFMPASVDHVVETAGVKVISVFPGNLAQGKPSITSLMVLISSETGEVEALLDGTELTRIRTGAVTACGTELLAREDARIGALFGTGGQAMTQLEGMLHARSLEEVKVYDQFRERIMAFIEAARPMAEARGCRLVPAEDPEEAVANAMVVTTVTTSSTPVFPGAMLPMGAHVNAIGAYTPSARELDTETLTRADLVFVDNLKAVMEEAGDLLIPISEGAFGPERITGELGEILLGLKQGRSSSAQITVMKSVGFGALDVVCARRALDLALKMGLGEELEI